MPIARKVFLTLILFIVMSVTTFAGITILLSQQEIARVTSTYGKGLAVQLAHSAGEPMNADDRLSLNLLLTDIQNSAHVDGVAIFKQNREILAQQGTEFWNPSLTPLVTAEDKGVFVTPIGFQGETKGYALVHLNPEQISSGTQTTLQFLMIAGVIISCIGALVAYLLAKGLTTPLHVLQNGLDKIAQGQFQTRLPEYGKNEIGQVMIHFNQVCKGLAEREQLLRPQRFPLGHEMEDSSEVQQNSQISFLAIDFAGHSRLHERYNVHEINQLLDSYYQFIGATVEQYGGRTQGFVGNYALIAFDQLHTSEDCTLSTLDALMCGIVILRLTEKFNLARARRGLASIKIRIGIHCGSAFMWHSSLMNQATLMTQSTEIAIDLSKVVAPGKIGISHSVLQAVGEHNLRVSESSMLENTGTTTHVTYYTLLGLEAKLRKESQEIVEALFQHIHPQVESPELI